MKKLFTASLILLVILLIVVSCEKLVPNSSIENTGNKQKAAVTDAGAPPSQTYYKDSMGTNHDNDSIERMTVLGMKLTNPYLIPNMQQAYANLGITNVAVTITNKYVRFKPTIDQLSALDSTMDAKGLDMFDVPLDYQILLEGDYYQDPSITDEQPTWQYATVPVNFVFPAGVQYEILASIHIPADNYTAVETEAERLAALQDGSNANALDNGGAQTNGLDCGTGYHYDYETHTCVANNDCPTGYYWDGNACVPNTTPPPPPPPAPDAAVPAGGITVDETQPLAGLATSPTTSQTGSAYRLAPIRNARVVARRWFKTERTYTDINGHFQFTKHFKHKVCIIIKFKNNDAIVRSMRGIRLWQMLFPLKKTLGVYSGDKNNITYNFAKYDNSVHAKGNRYWAGGTVHNAVQEYKDFAATESIGLPPGKLRILVTDMTAHGEGASPMWNKRWLDDLPKDFAVTYLSGAIGVTVPLVAVIAVLKHEIDDAISFNGPSGNYADFESDDLKTTTYHELTHAAHYNKLGNAWHSQFVNQELSEISLTLGSQYSPYGDGNMSNRNEPLIALGESWAYYMGHYMADKRYGALNSQPQSEQNGKFFYNTTSTSGSVVTITSAHINVLEGFDPNYTNDPFHWIPLGVYQDLRDANNINDPVIDNVSGYYTNQMLFNAFSSSITTLQGYRANLLQQNINNQSTQVTSLFAVYGY